MDGKLKVISAPPPLPVGKRKKKAHTRANPKLPALLNNQVMSPARLGKAVYAGELLIKEGPSSGSAHFYSHTRLPAL